MSDFWRVLRLARPHRLVVVATVACIAVATLVEVGVFPLFAGLIFGVLFPSDAANSQVPALVKHLPLVRSVQGAAGATKLHWVLLACAGILVSYLVRCVALFGAMYMSQFIAQRVMYTLRERVYGRLLRLSLAFHDRHAVGDSMSRITNDVVLTQNMISVQLADLVATVITFVIGVGGMLIISWRLTLLSVILVPLTAYTISRAGRGMRRAQTNIQQRLAHLASWVQERLHSVRIIQSFAREDYEDECFAEISASNVEANLRSARILALLGPLVEYMGMVGMVVGIAFAGWQVILGRLSAEELAPFFIIAQRVGQRFSKIGNIHLSIQQGIAAVRRIFEILDQEATVPDAPDAVALPKVRGRVRFHDLSFAYPGGAEVLNGINLEVTPGEVVALVGPSGVGKSTLVNLLPRFYDPSSGRVEIDGWDLRRVTVQSLRAQVGIVPQETILFSGSVYDNVRYGKLEATPEEVYAAARAANAEQFIRALPQGYDFDVGERGLRLSGGQRQRIAIARALLKDPAILVLDEATSSLDMESEALVQEALERLMKGRTTFIIAHRLPTVRNADRILVLGDGRVIEQGTHEALVARGGLYRRLYQMQFREAPARE
ncbi:MAG TPA: ABC transporter ATP-binding protein [Armatimonadota bacterium]|nr:ABC transporter ATP-binding protein [Armatimonadota bacterium]